MKDVAGVRAHDMLNNHHPPPKLEQAAEIDQGKRVRKDMEEVARSGLEDPFGRGVLPAVLRPSRSTSNVGEWAALTQGL